MTSEAFRVVSERRAMIRAEATALGIDDAYIRSFVREFYGRVREDAELGPIFERTIGDHWEAHFRRIDDFWASVAFNAGRYSGEPVAVHKRLEGVKPHHFQTWLGIFRQTLDDTAPSDGAIDWLMERANRIARSLEIAMFGLKLDPPPTR
ncbi:MAG: group III truncated hemoglobin [Geminicoccaceae bacterium]